MLCHHTHDIDCDNCRPARRRHRENLQPFTIPQDPPIPRPPLAWPPAQTIPPAPLAVQELREIRDMLKEIRDLLRSGAGKAA